MIKHNLKHNGAAYNESAELINPDPKVTSGEGRALCTCGAISTPLPSGGARRAWHKDHKAAAAAEAPQQTELVLGQDVAAGTPEDEVAEALAELVEEPKAPKAKRTPKAKKVSTRRKAEQAAGFMPELDEANAHTARLPFTTDIADSYWRFLGRDAVRHLVDTAYPTVTARTDANAHAITFTGPEADVLSAVEAVETMWADAIAAAAEWKKTDPEFLARPTAGLEGRKASYHMTGAFYVAFAEHFAAEHTPPRA